MSDDKIIKGVFEGLGQIGVETVEKIAEEGGKIVETIITGEELLGLKKTMTDEELAIKKQQEEVKKQQEIKKLKGEMGQNEDKSEENKAEKQPKKKHDLEEEMTELRRQKEKEEEEKEKYYEQQKQQKEKEQQQQMAEYDSLNMESTNPAKQKKSRGSAFIQGKKRKSQPTQSQMSQTQEFKGKID